jgi:hypothetical protein
MQNDASKTCAVTLVRGVEFARSRIFDMLKVPPLTVENMHQHGTRWENGEGRGRKK